MAVMSVVDAARQLGVDASRVRQMLRLGDLAGERVGAVWLVDAGAVARRAHRPAPAGRPIAAARAWGLLDLLSGGSAPWLSSQRRSQVRALGRGLHGASPDRWRAALRGRSERLGFRAHSAALRRLLADPEVIVGGPPAAAEAGLDLVAVDARPEVYVRPADLPRLVRTLALRPADNDAADVVVRVPREVWPFCDGQISAGGLAADLIESDEPRAVSAGAAWLNGRGLPPAGPAAR